MHNHNNHPSARRSRAPRRLLAGAALVASLALIAAACGGSDDGDSAGASGQPAATITTPADGAQVGRSFEVAMDLGFEIGEPDTGRQHIHLHYDGSSEYDIVYADTHAVTSLDAGEHSIVAVVANADHSETDSRSEEVTVQVGDAAGVGETEPSPSETSPTEPETSPPAPSDDGFDY